MDNIQTTIVTPQVIHYLGIDIAKDKFDIALTIKAALNDVKGKDRHKAKVFANSTEGLSNCLTGCKPRAFTANTTRCIALWKQQAFTAKH